MARERLNWYCNYDFNVKCRIYKRPKKHFAFRIEIKEKAFLYNLELCEETGIWWCNIIFKNYIITNWISETILYLRCFLRKDGNHWNAKRLFVYELYDILFMILIITVIHEWCSCRYNPRAIANGCFE